jgi:hypothetical protein
VADEKLRQSTDGKKKFLPFANPPTQESAWVELVQN